MHIEKILLIKYSFNMINLFGFYLFYIKIKDFKDNEKI